MRLLWVASAMLLLVDRSFLNIRVSKDFVCRPKATDELVVRGLLETF